MHLEQINLPFSDFNSKQVLNFSNTSLFSLFRQVLLSLNKIYSLLHSLQIILVPFWLQKLQFSTPPLLISPHSIHFLFIIVLVSLQ